MSEETDKSNDVEVRVPIKKKKGNKRLKRKKRNDTHDDQENTMPKRKRTKRNKKTARTGAGEDRNNNNTENENETERINHQNKINNIIKARKYIKYHLQSICSKNGLSNQGLKPALLQRLYDKLDVDMDVLQVAPPEDGRRNSSSRAQNDDNGDGILHLLDSLPLRQRRQNATEATNDDEDEQASVPQNDAETTATNNSKKKKRAAQNVTTLARHEMMVRIDELEALLIEMRGIDASDSADAISQLIARMRQLYAAAPRAPRNQYKGSTAFISDRNLRYKQYENVFARLKTQVYELACQTRSPMIIAGANGAAYGRITSSSADMWISPAMLQTDEQVSQDIYGSWNDAMDYYADHWREIQDKYEDEMIKARVSKLFQQANIQNKEAVKEMARNLNLNFVVDAIDEPNVVQQPSNNRNHNHNGSHNHRNRKHEMEAADEDFDINDDEPNDNDDDDDAEQEQENEQ